MTAQLRAEGTPPLPFGLYADVYDLIYADKNYEAEALFVVSLLQRFLAPWNLEKRIVDLACGTGRHALQLASMGFRVTGSDISSAMVSIARKAASERALKVPFSVQSFQNCGSLGGKYDAALAMFASLGYLLSDEDLSKTLAGVRALLAPNGIFVFDVWNGDAVVKDYAPVREKHVSNESLQVTRISRTTLDKGNRVATVNFEFDVTRRASAPAKFAEVHRVRYFFPDELVRFLENHGFDVVLQCPFLEQSRDLAPSDWNMTFVVRPL
jgi:SAM-dependent methyltransferase